MSRDIKDIMAGKKTGLTDKQVIAYLKKHPDFLNRHPDLFQNLIPPTEKRGENIVDMQRFMVRRLADQIDQHKQQQKDLVKTVRGNQHVQAQVFSAILAMLNAANFEHLIHIVLNDLPLYLDVDVVNICVESDEVEFEKNKPTNGSLAGIHLLPFGTIDYLIGAQEKVVLRDSVVGDPTIFGEAAPLIQSDALIKIEISEDSPPGLLAFGSRNKDAFDSKQATDLLIFMAQVLESCVRAWLGIDHP